MIVTLTKKLFQKLSSKDYRAAYVEENVRTGLAYQIRALREQRRWKQEEFGKRIGGQQSTLSRLEDPAYGRMTVGTLLKIASACDIGLLVKFVTFEEMLIRSRDVSPKALEVSSWDPTKFGTDHKPQIITSYVPRSRVVSEGFPQVVRTRELEVSL